MGAAAPLRPARPAHARATLFKELASIATSGDRVQVSLRAAGGPYDEFSWTSESAASGADDEQLTRERDLLIHPNLSSFTEGNANRRH